MGGGSLQKRYRKIDPDKWYMVDTLRLDIKGKPKMLKKQFDNQEQVMFNIKQHFPNSLRFDAIKGIKAIELGLYVMNAIPNLQIYLRKYRYSADMITDQDKKSYRTKFRRQNRTKKGELYKRWG